MSIEQAIQISLVDFLASMEFHPAQVRGYKLWYLSPFRAESKPSFKVNVEMNLWYDFGEGVGGGIIPLAKRLFGTDDIAAILKRMETQPGIPVCAIPARPPSVKRKEEPTMKNIHSQPLTHHALADYLAKRGIPLEIGRSYCCEVHYEIHGKRYFALGFPNSSGGYELRNPYFKGCMGRKDITILKGEEVKELDTSCCHVFEGFFDFLSFRVLQAMGKLRLPSYGSTHYIILNSVNNLGKALREMTHIERIFTYLDNDQAGRKATETILGLYAPRTVDLSFMFEDHNDLNDYLLHLNAEAKKQ